MLRVVLGNISNQKLIEILEANLTTIEDLDKNEYFFIEIGTELTIFYPS
jgi:hypothetical protein